MRKLVALLTAVVLVLTGCSAAAGADDDVLVINERFFVSRINDIHMNPQSYLGRTIMYEGMFASFPDMINGGYIHIGYRYTEGCCGPYEPLGFGLTLEDIEPPANDSWVQIVGVVEALPNRAHTVLRINVTSLTELDERGEEFVSGWAFQDVAQVQ
ncbi:MAG: hypothetical protein FWD98_05715 [Defluviitaleaceae bacterium]|nr:hypothetical protein [Defluviitaleaceae bacterium]